MTTSVSVPGNSTGGPLRAPALSAAQLREVERLVDVKFLLPLLQAREQTHAGTHDRSARPRLALSPRLRRGLTDYEQVGAGRTRYPTIASQERVRLSTVTRRRDDALTLMATTSFVLFHDPDRFNIATLFRQRDAEVQASVLEDLLAAANAQCDAFDQLGRAQFDTGLAYRLRSRDPRCLSNSDRALLARAAQTFVGVRRTALAVQAFTSQRASIDLTPRITSSDYVSLTSDEQRLPQAMASYEGLASAALRALSGPAARLRPARPALANKPAPRTRLRGAPPSSHHGRT